MTDSNWSDFTVCLYAGTDVSQNTILYNAVNDFVEGVGNYLFEFDQTVLVGDTYSVADVVVALTIGASCQVVGLSTVPQQTYRWLSSTLHNVAQCCNDKQISGTIQEYLDNIKEGSPSPETKVVSSTVNVSATDVNTTSTENIATAKDVTAEPIDSTPPVVPSDASTPSSEDNAILKLLESLQIPYEVYSHQQCNTAEELVTNVPIPEGHTHTKNLFLRDKKHGIFLVTVGTNVTVNTKELGKQLKLEGKTNLRMAESSVLEEKLHVKPGCVGPLCIGLANNKEEDVKEKVTMVLDQALLDKYATIHSHPLRNDMSVKIKPDALKDFFSKVGVEPTILDFSSHTTSVVDSTAPKPPVVQQQEKPKKAKSEQESQNPDKKTGKKGETLLALQWKKTENFPMWYSDVIVLSEMISYYDISGCYILRPWSYKIWELIQYWFNEKIEELGVENAYFPLFVSKDRLEIEKDHVEGFAPEVAWVTKSGEGDLAKPIAIRPTSETIMYPAYSDWIRSHRDLPLKLNQWSNVVRWEFKYPTPFLRTREFLWQEGHTAHATYEDADDMVMKALDLYRRVYEELLAVPVVPGYKTEKEKFAGGYRTTTVEAYIAGSGRAIQGATSHNLGQNFGKMFDITFQDEQGKKQIAWQTSWGLTTRTIGVMVMVHGDDNGLVMPPRISPVQVVIVPIISKNLTLEQANPYCKKILDDLKQCNIRVKYDDRLIYNPGWKYNHWEQKGVPIRIEVGPRDIEQSSVRVVVRHNGAKEDFQIDGLGSLLKQKLEDIQTAMFVKAKEARDSHVVTVTEWKDFVPNLEKRNLVLTPWCGGEHQEWEEWVKTTSKEESLKLSGEDAEDAQTSTSVAAKTLCIPFDQPELPPGTKCIASGMDAKCWVLWGRSY
jgi:prolyl-tRNA synthetase